MPAMDRDHQADRQSDLQADHEATGLTISQAARLLGVSENAIRQRLKRQSLPAAKVEGVWRIWLPDQEGRPGADHQPDQRPDQEGDQGATTSPVAVSPAAVAQLVAIRDQWLQPLVAQIREQAELIGQLRAERDQAAQERDDLRAEVERLRAVPPVPDAPRTSPAAPGGAEPSEPGHGSRWRRWLRRLVEG